MEIKQRYTDKVIFGRDNVGLRKVMEISVAERVNLLRANLADAKLSDAKLSRAKLPEAYLSRADLYHADLSNSNLSYSDLSHADLCDSNLSGASLYRADLSGAYLVGANLAGALLVGADLSGADLHSVRLTTGEVDELAKTRTIVAEGDIIGWKKLANGELCKLKIPAGARRVGGIVGRKCRAEYAIVMDGEGESPYKGGLKYSVGATVHPDKFDPNPLVECSHGIHFFITKAEAEQYMI